MEDDKIAGLEDWKTGRLDDRPSMLPSLPAIVHDLAPSPEQSPAIAVRGSDVVVTAGAGTGKTRTLVARTLALLAEGTPHRSIVAITFTEKAAREMRNRVRDQVRRYLQQPEVDQDERRRWEETYVALDAARIGTIHSLCAEILRTHPAEAGVDPRFGVLDEGQANILKRRAVDEALAWAADDQQASTLFALLGEGGLRSMLEALLQNRLAARECLATLPDPLWPAWQARVVPALHTFLDDGRVQAAFADLLALRANGLLARAQAAGDRLAEPLQRLLGLWDEIAVARGSEDWPAVSRRLAALRGEMKQAGQATHWAPANPKATIKELQGLYDMLLAPIVDKGIDLALDQTLAEAMPALRRALDRVLDAYDRMKHDRQALDFDDLEQGALDLLRRHGALQTYWQQQVHAVLVDEFQDTNARQRDLVRLLAGPAAGGTPGGVFIVGDAKQSIYRFRGADVAVFRAERDQIQALGGTAVQLETSYRAHAELVQALNDLLLPVLGDRSEPGRPWLEPFSPLRAHRPAPGPGFAAPHVELLLAAGSKVGGALALAARAAAARIVELVESGSHGLGPQEDGGTRALDYGDVAILCRASTSFGAYEDALEGAGVPFLTVAGRGFYGRPEVRDVLNALRALADPADDLSLAGLLRSPAIALPDTALYRLCEERDRLSPPPSLWTLVAAGEVAAAWPDPDRERAVRAAGLIRRLNALVGRVPVADLLKAFLDATDYQAALLQAGQARAVRNVAKLLADAHNSGLVGVGEFLEYIAGLRDSGAREGEARAVAEGVVQIMTVHAAKGLEFPVVVLGDAGHAARVDRGLIVDPALGILWPLKDDQDRLPAVYRLAKKQADDQEAAEADRLLYVAATRAREKLIVSGTVKLREGAAIARPTGWLGRLGSAQGLALEGLPLAYDAQGDRVLSSTLQLGKTVVSCCVYEPGWAASRHAAPAPEEATLPVTLPPPLVGSIYGSGDEAEPGPAQERDRAQRVWQVVPSEERSAAPAWVVGSLVHEALATWHFPHTDLARWAEARARQYGVTDRGQLDDAIARGRRLLRRFRAHPLWKEMNEAERLLHEVPYSLPVDGGVESGIIDALYRQADRWTIVEFKTDRLAGEADLLRLLKHEDYRAQARRYRHAVESLVGERPRVIVCLLNYAGGVHLYPVEEDENDDPGSG